MERVRASSIVVITVVAIACAYGLSCLPKGRLATKLGPPKIVEVKESVVLKFDRQMVSNTAVGKRLEKAPLTIKPNVPGFAMWRSEQELVWRPAAAIPPSTRFEIVLSEKLRSLAGYPLSETARTLSFESPRIAVAVALSGIYPKVFRPLDQQGALTLSQPANGRQILKHCKYVASKHQIAVDLIAAEDDEVSWDFAVRPAEPLAHSTIYALRCNKGIVGTSGPLGSKKAAEAKFTTHDRFKVKRVITNGREIEPEYSTSFELELTNPISPRATHIGVGIDPSPGKNKQLSCYVVWNKRTVVRCSAHVQPETTYQVSVNPDLKDIYGQALGASAPVTFRTGKATASLFVETGQWVVEKARPTYVAWIRNIDMLQLTAARVPVNRLADLLPRIHWWDSAAVNLDELKIPSTKTMLTPKLRPSRWDQLRLEPSKLTGGGATEGFYYLALSREGKAHELLLNVTDLSLVTKLSGASGLVWVLSNSTGKPVSRARVVIRSDKGAVLWRGRTNRHGLARTPGRARLLAKAKRPAKRANADADDLDNEEDAGDRSSRGKPRLLIFAQKGKDQTFVDPDRAGGLAASNFNLSQDNSDANERLRGFLHTDRGIYRPGDTVHVKGLARALRLGTGLRVPRQRKLALKVIGPRGNTVMTKKARLSDFGGFALDLSLRGDARLGDYQVIAEHPLGNFRQTFAVEEYRPAAFEVKTRSAKAFVVAGNKIEVKTEARYFYGAPVRAGKIKWAVNRRARTARFSKHPGFTFGKGTSYWDSYGHDSSHEYVTEKVGKLSAAGLGSLKLRVKSAELSGDYDYLVRAEVSDESNQMVASRIVVPVAHRDRYLGIKIGSWFAPVNKPLRVKLLAVDPLGKAVAAKNVKLRVERVDWTCAYEDGGYRGAYRCQHVRKVVKRKRLTLAANKSALLIFKPKKSGRYVVSLEGKDGRGHGITASRDFYSWGRGRAAWRVNNTIRFDAIADKPRYRPGDTARLLLKTPLASAQGLLTIERDGVLEHRRFTLRPGQQSITVPIKAAHAPNVYATISLFRGRSGTGRRGKPVIRVAMVNLPVDSANKRLKVEIHTDRERYRPGSPVRARVKVTNARGKPVRSEISLAAADEGVLSLIQFKTPDPLPIFYAPWGLGVTSATALERLSHAPNPGEERDTTGGDSAPGSVRARFMSTAFWRSAIVTDERGEADVTFAAPDNLTAFRLMAVAADIKDRFGSGDLRFTVAKPLQLHQALPRFLNVGDEAKAGVVVHNETGAAGQAVVQARIEGLELRSARKQVVSVPAGGRVPVRFTIAALKPGQARLRFTVKLGRERDAVEHTLPVTHASVRETRLLKRGVIRKSRTANIPVKLPTGALPATAMLAMSVDLNGLAGMERGLENLVGYPYGCLEQTTSKVIPMLMVKELAREVRLANLDHAALRKYLRAGVAKIGRHQTTSGGFSLWPRSAPGTYYTAYALWGLHLAKKAGLDVAPERFTDGIKYLKRALTSSSSNSPIHNELGDQGSRAFALYVLGLLGKGDAQAATSLASASEMPLFGKAFLTRALASASGKKQPMVRQMLDKLEAKVKVNRGRALAKEDGGSDQLEWYMSSDVRTSAILLDTLVALRPRSKKVYPLVKGLMRAGRYGGNWRNTQETIYSLLALTRYAQRRASRAAVVEVVAGDEVVGSATLNRDRKVARIELPLARINGQRLRLRASGARVNYVAAVSFRRGAAYQKARFAGVRLSHSYRDPKTGRRLKKIRAGDVVKIQVVMRNKERLLHLMLSHRLPAAFEPINRRLATSGRKGDADANSGYDNTRWRGYRHLELRDERLDLAIERVNPGVKVEQFLVRATTPGRFVVPSSRAEEMYSPETFGRTKQRWLQVYPR